MINEFRAAFRHKNCSFEALTERGAGLIRVLAIILIAGSAQLYADELANVSSSSAFKSVTCKNSTAATQLKEIQDMFSAASQSSCGIDAQHTGICRAGKLIIHDLKTGKDTEQALDQKLPENANVVETLLVNSDKNSNSKDSTIAYQLKKDGKVDRINLATGEVKSKDLGEFGKSLSEQAKLGKFTGEKAVLSVPGAKGSTQVNLESLFQGPPPPPKPASSFSSLPVTSNFDLAPNSVPSSTPTSDFNFNESAKTSDSPSKRAIEIPCSGEMSQEAKRELELRGVKCAQQASAPSSTGNPLWSLVSASVNKFPGFNNFFGGFSKNVGTFARNFFPPTISRALFSDEPFNPSNSIESNDKVSFEPKSVAHASGSLAYGSAASGVNSSSKSSGTETPQKISEEVKTPESAKDLAASLISSSEIAEVSSEAIVGSGLAIEQKDKDNLAGNSSDQIEPFHDAPLFRGLNEPDEIIEPVDVQSQKSVPLAARSVKSQNTSSKPAQKNSQKESARELPSELRQSLAVLPRRKISLIPVSA